MKNGKSSPATQSDRVNLDSELLLNQTVTAAGGVFRLDFAWRGPAPRAGQFFMVKPARSGVFLPRPISVAAYDESGGVLRFLVARRGRGIDDLLAMRPGETAELTGPLGKAWADAAGAAAVEGAAAASTNGKPLALVGGGIGIAPLLFFATELSAAHISFEFYAGFRESIGEEECLALFGGAASASGGLSANGGLGAGGILEAADNVVLAAERVLPEHAALGFRQGCIPEFVSPSFYSAVFACGPEPMLKAVAASCKAGADGQAGVPCFVSLERRMACGVGACLGCTVETRDRDGAAVNKRCCADGPVFNAEDVLWK
jgi:NAD(P)H-flavin reductase